MLKSVANIDLLHVPYKEGDAPAMQDLLGGRVGLMIQNLPNALQHLKKGGRRIEAADAWDHIAGYTCYNDASVRDWQMSTPQWTAGKNFWKTGAFGPWMVTADEIQPDQRMTLITRLNGREMQRATTDMMIHSIPRLIAYISTFMPLSPGDILVTGTPGGVGSRREPQVFMKDGDLVEVEVDAIGILRNHVERERV